MAKIPVMTRDRHVPDHTAFAVGFYERRCETPENGITIVRAEPLQMLRVNALARDGVKVRLPRVIRANIQCVGSKGGSEKETPVHADEM
jgi:hypothetical protein